MITDYYDNAIGIDQESRLTPRAHEGRDQHQ